MVGWRRSADRTRLHANSLLTGNFTGNFSILGPETPISLRKAAALQRLLAQFPKQINRENLSKNREFSTDNREFHRPKSEPIMASYCDVCFLSWATSFAVSCDALLPKRAVT